MKVNEGSTNPYATELIVTETISSQSSGVANLQRTTYDSFCRYKKHKCGVGAINFTGHIHSRRVVCYKAAFRLPESVQE